MYVPPGIVKVKPTKIQQQSKLPKYIRQAQPSDTIYIRQSAEPRIAGLGDTISMLKSTRTNEGKLSLAAHSMGRDANKGENPFGAIADAN